MAKDELSQVKLQLQSAISQLEEQKHLVQNLRGANKTIREEMRKVQSSAQLMEKSRNPGVGYWSATTNGTAGPSGSSTPMTGVRSGDVTPISGKSTESVDGGSTSAALTGVIPSSSNGAPKGNDEEEVNLEVSPIVIDIGAFTLTFTVSPECHTSIPRKSSYAETTRPSLGCHITFHTTGTTAAERQDHSVTISLSYILYL